MTTENTPPVFALHLKRRFREGCVILIVGVMLFILAALITYTPSDPGWSHSGYRAEIHNATGKTGAFVSDVVFSLLGINAFLLPAGLLFVAVRLYREIPFTNAITRFGVFLRILGALLTLFACCGLATFYLSGLTSHLPMSAGGVLGALIFDTLKAPFHQLGSTIILIAAFLSGLTFFTGISWLKVLERIGQIAAKAAASSFRGLKFLSIKLFEGLRALHKKIRNSRMPNLGNFSEMTSLTIFKPQNTETGLVPTQQKRSFGSSLQSLKKNAPSLAASNTQNDDDDFDSVDVIIHSPAKPTKKNWGGAAKGVAHLLCLLEVPKQNQDTGFTEAQLQALSTNVEQRLAEFGATVKVVAVKPGPVITRFEMELAAGLKVSKISGLAKDLARALAVISVRVVEVIPGKPFVGLEIPNDNRQIVSLREILESEAFAKAPSPITLALGKDISGQTIVADLARMPHLLVAGTTGSGKSVGLNAMILSILFKATPDDVRFIMVDPKMLELSVYEGIPHLLAPVVTDMKDAAQALRWCVAEMERRYQLLAALGVRNLKGYNRKIEDAALSGNPIVDPLWPNGATEPAPVLEKLPFIVVVVDEFADMIMVVGKKVEELIARIAQKARAAGIHLILATQRPSVDVITGLIKANIPTRIAFQVSSRIDSRTILDQSGAEQLLGHGDMLFLPPGSGVPVRVHGAFVADEEVHKIVAELKMNCEPNYVDSLMSPSFSSTAGPGSLAIGSGGNDNSDEDNELYDQAVFIVAESRRATISYLQRRLKIGYNRAARLIERMENEGVVSAMQSNGSREILVPPTAVDVERSG